MVTLRGLRLFTVGLDTLDWNCGRRPFNSSLLSTMLCLLLRN